MDKITEEIAHFVGFWNLTVEDVRARLDYHKFQSAAVRHGHEDTPDAPGIVIKAPFDFDDYDPYVPYTPATPVQYWSHTAPPWTIGVPLELSPWQPTWLRFEQPVLPQPAFGGSITLHGTYGATIQPPGAVAAIVVQKAVMSDNDTVSLGGHDMTFQPHLAASEHIAPLLDRALDLAPLANAELPGSSAEIIAFVQATRGELDAYRAADHGAATVFVAKAAVLEGTYIDGALVQDAPDFRDFRPLPATEAAPPGPSLQPSFVHGTDAGLGHVAEGTQAGGDGTSFVRPSSVDLQAGDNTLVNTLTLTSNWLAASVTAVVGDHVEMNVVSQVNVWTDLDKVATTFGGAAADAQTIGFNIAGFTRIDPTDGDHATGTGAGGHDFPTFWAITQITGDLLIMNWVEQINFMTDNDVATLAAAGTKMQVVTGTNAAINEVSLTELGHYYDLIIVGGSVYDANIIAQMNVLLDNDTVDAAAGFGAAHASGVSTGGNLLWNQANIVNVGAADRFDALSGAYRNAADQLAKGDKSTPVDALRDEAFAGMGAVRALFITGDIINLQFVKQTNVLGDVDKVMAAMNATTPDAQAQWSISTGHNTLVNSAAILDVDSLGTTHVGGGIYSDEILIQADLIPTTATLHPQGGDALVNEAIAFLGDDAAVPLGGTSDGPASAVPLSLHAAQADPMHILAS